MLPANLLGDLLQRPTTVAGFHIGNRFSQASLGCFEFALLQSPLLHKSFWRLFRSAILKSRSQVIIERVGIGC